MMHLLQHGGVSSGPNDVGRSSLRLTGNVVALDEAKYVFESMLDGWSDQQASRGLLARTIDRRRRFIEHFTEYCATYPWQWQPQDLEDYSTRGRSGAKLLSRSTLRGYQTDVRLFCEFLTDQRYGWQTECLTRFGSAPQQICHDWNTITHLLEYEGSPGRRALTFDELEQFFDAADARVETIVHTKRKGALAALRNAQMFKTIYAFGLRRSECVGLDIADLRSNPVATQFGSFGAVYVRHGKGTRGTGPKRRTVLTVPEFDWIVDGLTHWVDQGWPRMTGDWETGILWPTERRTRVSPRYLNDRFAELRDEVGLPEELTLHSLRHTYVTNLIEWGYSEKFVQDQVGHAFASTTAIYTSVGDDYKNRVLADALKRNTKNRNDN
ncbi:MULTISPECIES: tyrosine-type recombinase/integrase [unclassified Microbacterium]|uniref:tyrosine-type recombinase/integrase n=1 Tax=unclassified Microbacterium TaxID=2609290 RepID=UPI000A787A74|nr:MULTISPECIES: tyrosine-type recombinase/integrase [unclassified Microbacterium]